MAIPMHNIYIVHKNFVFSYRAFINFGPAKQATNKYKPTIDNVGKGLDTNAQLATRLSVTLLESS